MLRSSILRSLNSCSKKQNMIKQPQAAHVVISMFSIPSFWRKKSMQIIGLLIERKRTQRSHRGVYLFWGHLDIKIANNLKVMEEAWHFDFFGSAEAKLTQTPTKFKLFGTVASLLNKISVWHQSQPCWFWPIYRSDFPPHFSKGAPCEKMILTFRHSTKLHFSQ